MAYVADGFRGLGRIAVPKHMGCVLLATHAEVKKLTGSDDPQSLLDLVGRKWHLGVDRTGRGYPVSVEGSVLEPCGYPTWQMPVPNVFFCTKRRIPYCWIYRLEHNPDNPVGIFRLPMIATLSPWCMHSKNTSTRKKQCNALCGFYIDKPRKVGSANCICKHEQWRIYLISLKIHVRYLKSMMEENIEGVQSIKHEIDGVKLLTWSLHHGVWLVVWHRQWVILN